MHVRLGLALVVAACSAQKPVPTDNKPEPTQVAATKPVAIERRAVVKIDAKPDAKKFQGVFLVFPDGKEWIISYRRTTLWTWFENREVIVTGGCYEPVGARPDGAHFRVDTMRAATVERGRAPYLSIGPVQTLLGEVVTETAPEGSKLAGSSRELFRTETGKHYAMLGDQLPKPGSLWRIRAREIEPDMSHHARQDGPDLWIHSVDAPDYEPDPEHAPRDVPCPGD